MATDWLSTVDDYLNQLGDALDRVNYCGTMFLEHTSAGKFSELDQASQELEQATRDLEKLLETRGEILRLATPPEGTRPRSLRAALRQANDQERLALAEQLATRVEDARKQSVSLFVTQYQLFETSQLILSTMLSRGPDPGTYGPKPKRNGGGLLDDAA